ncbi:MAG: hypothetical protein R3C12_20005, partial [Planctomycetaceae bacterium]
LCEPDSEPYMPVSTIAPPRLAFVVKQTRLTAEAREGLCCSSSHEATTDFMARHTLRETR